MIKLVAAAGLAAGLSLPACLPAVAAQGATNGIWSVELVTESGLCSARYSYALAIRQGQVQLVSGGAGARVSGHVGADGRVGLSVTNGTASGTGTGRLQSSNGSGTWQVASLCSGRWTARRSDDRTAQAD
ncbi:hypothetical protein [Methylobacterium sp. NEAU K]|uniref:hypothetical protein n=1 Tax=Methylobacterium sp. NEAU K TaxID=3064946 RepID=UPI0027339E17|nr:hypothetical protein [Methylobacterium sp. NEAU K]MDP4004020.1 hypothetical protein [Methylobacterium sp. NEAU K]